MKKYFVNRITLGIAGSVLMAITICFMLCYIPFGLLLFWITGNGNSGLSNRIGDFGRWVERRFFKLI